MSLILLKVALLAPAALAGTERTPEPSPCDWEDAVLVSYPAPPHSIPLPPIEGPDVDPPAPGPADLPIPAGGIPTLDPNDLDLFVVCIKNGEVRVMCDLGDVHRRGTAFARDLLGALP